MGDVLAELEVALRSKPRTETLSSGEEMILQTCKAKAIRSFTFGACASSAVTWAVTRSLTNGQRLNFSVASAVLVGMWKFNRSLSECVDQIIGLEGSRMQWELANIILTRHRENSSKVQLVRKYFYPEAVFSDMNPDKSFYRWRPRHSFVDNTAVQRSEEAEVNIYHEKTNDPQLKKLTSNTGQEMAAQRGSIKDNSAHKSSGGEMIVDPFDCIFGHEDTHEVELSDKATALPRRRLRAHKRAHRRRHANHSEILDN